MSWEWNKATIRQIDIEREGVRKTKMVEIRVSFKQKHVVRENGIFKGGKACNISFAERVREKKETLEGLEFCRTKTKFKKKTTYNERQKKKKIKSMI